VATQLRDHGNPTGLRLRPAKALIGWMEKPEAQVALGIPEHVLPPLPEYARKVEQARAAVRARPVGVDQTHAISDTGPELSDYVAEFEKHPDYKPLLISGCTVRIANLLDICAVQPIVHSDYAEHAGELAKLLEQAQPDDMVSVARITLPLTTPVQPAMRFEAQQNAWITHSANPGARIAGHFDARLELRPGVFGMGYGFCVVLPPSFLQVVLYRGRYFLKDGYHRSVLLLRKGIAQAPVIFEELEPNKTLVVEGRFPDAVILSDRPPRLSDYLRDDVAAAVSHLAFNKTITIHAEERRAWGEL